MACVEHVARSRYWLEKYGVLKMASKVR